MTRRRGCESILRGRWPLSCFSFCPQSFPPIACSGVFSRTRVRDSQNGGCLFTRGKCLSRVWGRGLKTCGCDLLSVHGTRRTDFRICSPAARICREETASRNRVSAPRESAGAIRDAENAFRLSEGAIRQSEKAIRHRKERLRGTG